MVLKSNAPHMVCFGDSLTAGYQTSGSGFGLALQTPPGSYLQQWVGPSTQIVVSGICGEVTGEMVYRFPRDVVGLSPKRTVILGGTNDLGCGVVPSKICQNLEGLYRLALDAEIEPVGVTVPSILVGDDQISFPQTNEADSDRPLPGWLKNHIDQRLVLNQMIQESCQTLKIQCLDLFSETSEGSHQLLAAKFSSDGLHFNAAGYEVFARLIWHHLLAESFGACPPSS